MSQFTAKTEPITITLPTDMTAYLRLRKEKIGIPISSQIRMAVERDIMDRAQARVLVDPGVEYEVTEP